MASVLWIQVCTNVHRRGIVLMETSLSAQALQVKCTRIAGRPSHSLSSSWIAREDLVGQALTLLQEKHGITREELFIQTKYIFGRLPYAFPDESLDSRLWEDKIGTNPCPMIQLCLSKTKSVCLLPPV
jgi:hypothetical protein